MADLQLAPFRERSVVPALVIALVALSGIAAAVFWFNPHKVADLQVTAVQTFAPHTELKALTERAKPGGMRVLDGASSTSEDDLYLVATVSFTDRLRLPVYLSGVTAKATLSDGTQAQARFLSASDLQRIKAIFPALAPLVSNPIQDDEEIDPSKTRVGSVVLLFPGQSAESWKRKREATLTVALRNQEPQTSRLP